MHARKQLWLNLRGRQLLDVDAKIDDDYDEGDDDDDDDDYDNSILELYWWYICWLLHCGAKNIIVNFLQQLLLFLTDFDNFCTELISSKFCTSCYQNISLHHAYVSMPP